jgi:hypothetical protein
MRGFAADMPVFRQGMIGDADPPNCYLSLVCKRHPRHTYTKRKRNRKRGPERFSNNTCGKEERGEEGVIRCFVSSWFQSRISVLKSDI